MPSATNTPLAPPLDGGRRLGSAFARLVALRIWVALCVTALTLFCAAVLQGRCASLLASGSAGLAAAIACCATLALYNFDALLDERRDAAAVARSPRWRLLLTVLSAAGLCIVLLAGPARLRLIVIPGFALCALYAVRLLLRGRVVELKRVPHLKAPFVGFAVGSAALLVPFLANTLSVDYPAYSLFALWLSLGALCTTNALLFDVPDLRQDLSAGVPTRVARVGLGSLRREALAWIIVGGVGALFALPSAQLGLLVLALALLFATVRVVPEASKASVALWVDGALLLPLLTHSVRVCAS